MGIGDISYGFGSLISFIPANFVSGLWTNPWVIGLLMVAVTGGALYFKNLLR